MDVFLPTDLSISVNENAENCDPPPYEEHEFYVSVIQEHCPDTPPPPYPGLSTHI